MQHLAENRDRPVRLAVAAQEHIDRGVVALRPSVDSDVRLRENGDARRIASGQTGRNVNAITTANRPLTATSPGPPARRPATTRERLMTNSPAPERRRKAPKMMNRKT